MVRPLSPCNGRLNINIGAIAAQSSVARFTGSLSLARLDPGTQVLGYFIRRFADYSD